MTHITITFTSSEEPSECYINLSPQNKVFISIIHITPLSASICCSRHAQNCITSPVQNRFTLVLAHMLTDQFVCEVSSGKSANWHLCQGLFLKIKRGLHEKLSLNLLKKHLKLSTVGYLLYYLSLWRSGHFLQILTAHSLPAKVAWVPQWGDGTKA